MMNGAGELHDRSGALGKHPDFLLPQAVPGSGNGDLFGRFTQFFHDPDFLGKRQAGQGDAAEALLLKDAGGQWTHDFGR